MTTSFESRIARLLDEQAERDQPPARVSVGAAIRRGTWRLRWRRLGLAAGAPAMAAAVIAMAVICVVPLAGYSGDVAQATTSAPDPAQAKSMPVLRTDARFGWLPPGEELRSGLQSAGLAYMNVYKGRAFSWDLTIWAADSCALHSTSKKRLVCQFGGGVAPMTYLVGSHRASIRRHQAFWISDDKEHGITWEYAPGVWAVFQSQRCCSDTVNRQPAATLLRIADGIRFGPASGEPIRFDFQLTDVPNDLDVSLVSYEARAGSLLAISATLTAQKNPRRNVSIGLMRGGHGNDDPCWSSAAGPTMHAKLRGYDVETTTNPASYSDGGSDTYSLCAPDVGGSAILISMSDHAGRTPTELFEHMRFLGLNPANWATNPIS